ncbi:hypothetical protein FA13DRAFT_1712442 [Coprinellus micaceus]|uniref:Uncharacterized protein n=1 Tax=Coprinellus micaceus TaxID=71717 RepID=A0A4Y7T0Q2_COPMI|nr:hypothetical protein FA13DRAFT_1712442 [Coprinellus micaceus]
MTTTSDRQTDSALEASILTPACTGNMFPRAMGINHHVLDDRTPIHPDDRGATRSKFETRREGKCDKDLSAESPFSSPPWIDRSLLDSSTHSTRYRLKPASSSIPKFLLFSSLLFSSLALVLGPYNPANRAVWMKATKQVTAIPFPIVEEPRGAVSPDCTNRGYLVRG